MTWQPKQTVVVPIDFSDSTSLALETARQFVESPANLHVVYVVPALETPPPFGSWNARDIAASRREARENMNTLLIAHELEDATGVVLSGDPGWLIVEYAEQNNADLIVIPSHGHHGLKRLMLGSTAERVIRHTHCPVYVLRRAEAKE